MSWDWAWSLAVGGGAAVACTALAAALRSECGRLELACVELRELRSRVPPRPHEGSPRGARTPSRH